MCKLLRVGILITFEMLIICIISGCADDDSTENVDHAHSVPSVRIWKVYPDARNLVCPHTQFVLNLNEGVAAVNVNNIPATGAGRNWMVMPGLEVGTARLNIEWINRDGSRGATTVGPYIVLAGLEVLESPAITRGTVRNGEADVDPAPINASGLLFFFDEPVTGAIKLTDEACADLNWTGTVDDQTAALTPVAGQELANNTVYKIEIDVQNGGGNRFRATITFVTKPE